MTRKLSFLCINMQNYLIIVHSTIGNLPFGSKLLRVNLHLQKKRESSLLRLIWYENDYVLSAVYLIA